MSTPVWSRFAVRPCVAVLRSSRPAWLRRWAVVNLIIFCWSFVLATPMQALGSPPGTRTEPPSKPVNAPPASRPVLNDTIPHLNLQANSAPARYARRPVTASPTLWDEVGKLRRDVSPSQVAAWKRQLRQRPLSARRAARLNLWLGEVALAQQEQPAQALHHLRQVQRLTKPSSALYGLAAYDSAIVLYYEGAYNEAVTAFHRLLHPKTALSDYDRRTCALFWRHAVACAGYHAERAKLGIPEPPKLDPLCGAAALAACLRGQGQPFDKKTILSACRVTGLGSRLQDLLEAARKLGRAAYPVAADDQALIALPKPLVAYVEHDHFIALLRADTRGVSYLCSDCGAWPGGRVDLTWQQWHALEPTAYVAVCAPGSAWDYRFRQLPKEPTVSQQSRPVQLASTRLAGLNLRQSLPIGQLYLLASAAILSCGPKPNAQHCTDGVIRCPMEPGRDPCDPGPSAGDPVNLATGEEEYTPAPDLVVYNPVGPSVVWRRIYNSLRGGSYNVNPPASPYSDFDFGMGWSHPYNLHVYDPDHTTASTKYVILPNGGRIAFTAPAVPSAGNPTVHCTVQTNMPVLIDWNYDTDHHTSLGVFAITWPDRTQWFTTSVPPDQFGQPVTRIQDRNGNRLYLNLTYSPTYQTNLLRSLSTGPNGTGTVLLSVQRSNPVPMVTSVSDCYGRSVYYQDNLTLDVVTQVSQVVATGTANPPMRWSYGYLTPQNMGFFLQSITVPSPNGSGTQTAYIQYITANGSYLVYALVDANGNRREFTYNMGSTTVTIKDSSQNAVYSYTVGYNADMGETTRTDGKGTTIRTLTYSDPLNRYCPSSVTDGNNNVWYYSWDSVGHLRSVTTPRGITTTLNEDYFNFPLGELASVQTTGKQATSFTYYEPSGLLHTITSPKPGTSNGGLNVTTSFTYDSLGNVLTITQPGNDATANIVTTFNYTADGTYSQAAAIGQPLTVTDNLGKVTHLRYYTSGYNTGDLSSVTDALGNQTTFSYNIVNQPTQITLPATGQSGTGHSARTFVYTYPGGPVTTLKAFNESNVQVSEVDHIYGNEGELLSVLGGAEPVTYTYDAAYRISTLTDGNNHTTRYYYKQRGYLDAITYPGYTGPTPIYNVGMDSYTNVSGPDSVSYPIYDNDGNPLMRLDGRGIETDYSYVDVESRLTQVYYGLSNPSNFSLTYDSFGRVASRTDGTGSATYSYDDRDVLTSTTTTYIGLPAKTISYTFNADGSRASMVTPAGTYSYTHDADGRLASLVNPASRTMLYTYLDNGWLNTVQSSNVCKVFYTYNALGQVTRLRNFHYAAALMSDFSSLTHDGAGNLVSLSASLPDVPGYGGATGYTYDTFTLSNTRSQLVQETSTRNGGYASSYGYDAAFNPITFKGVAQLFNSDNQPTTNTYDGNGNPTTYKGTGFTYDARNRVTAIGSTLTAGYTADGLRAWKQSSAGRTYYLYDGRLPVCELSSSGSVTATNTFGPSGLLHRKAGTAQTFYTFDPFSNVCQRLDETGTLLSSHIFDAYGSFASTVSTTNDPYSGYGGQWGYYTDWETGLQLCGFRYYDAAAGRWLNRDPLGYGGGINLYGYVGNNPANLADPLGLFMDDTTFGQMLNPSTWAAGLATSGSALLCLLGFCDPCHEKDPGFGVSKACWNVAMQAGLMAATGGLGEAGEAAEGANASEFFHGTDVDSALNLLNGADLDAATAAANKIDGPAGFFLASDADDAAFFAARRSGTVLKYTFSDSAMEQLEAEGMIRQPIPSGPRSPNFNGDELQIPPSAFGRFNQLRRAGDITVTPHRF